jgi:hypothetical protein
MQHILLMPAALAELPVQHCKQHMHLWNTAYHIIASFTPKEACLSQPHNSAAIAPQRVWSSSMITMQLPRQQEKQRPPAAPKNNKHICA